MRLIFSFFRDLDQITNLLIYFDESNQDKDVLGNWLPKYIFAWFDIQGKAATRQSICWESKQVEEVGGEGKSWNYSIHVLLHYQ